MSKKSKPATKPATAALSDTIRKSMLQIWRAGLGAFSKAQREGGTAFAALVEQGAALQRSGCEMANTAASGMTQSAKTIASAAGQRTSRSLHRVETRLEDGMAEALRTLGVPTRRDLQQLIERVEKLSAAVDAFARERAGAGAAGRAAKEKKGSAKVSPKAPANQRAANSAAGRL